MGLKEVKSELNKLDKNALIKHIAELYKKYKPVKEYFDFFVNPDETKLLKQYKDKVTEGFFPKRGYNIKLSVSRKAINDFKKLSASKDSLADLLLHYVECGVELTNSYGDMDENFYTSLENTYEAALKLIYQNGLLKKFKTRALRITDNTVNIGWGFHDSLEAVYYEYYD
jgi:hypothetical protein